MDGLRIIAGVWRGRRIAAPPSTDTRPLTDRIRQSLCDWLGQDFTGLHVIDTCAGSGSFGLECASRGAERVDLVESGAAAAAVIADNIALLAAGDRCRLHHADAVTLLPGLTGADLIFCDPPFPWFRESPVRIAALLTAASGAMRPTGAVVIRGERGQSLPPVDALVEEERRTWGRSWAALLRLAGPG